jgi:hypothetical protein
MSSKVDVRSINEIRKLGIDALAEALGPVDMARFLQSFDLGSGDYTKERAGWLDQSLDEILEEIKRKRKELIKKSGDRISKSQSSQVKGLHCPACCLLLPESKGRIKAKKEKSEMPGRLTHPMQPLLL